MKLDTARVNSFPSTKRASVNKLMTENSVTRLINRLVDVDGFVITTGLDDIDFTQDIPVDAWSNAGADFEFVIRGYYFSISKDTDVSGLAYLLNSTQFDPSDEAEHTLFAGIIIDKTDEAFPELYGQDDISGKYQAISFYIDDDRPEIPDSLTSYDYYEFPLVQYMQQDNGAWGRFVSLESLFKFNSKSISNIDGGEISL